MKIDLALTHWEGKELESVMEFWLENRHEWPLGDGARREALIVRMQDQKVVEDKLEELPARLRDLLRFSIDVFDWRKPFDLDTVDPTEMPIEAFEIAPVTQALIDRGYFLPRRLRGARKPTAFSIPSELAEALCAVFELGRRPAEASLSLTLYLRSLDRQTVQTRLSALGLESYRGRPRAELREELLKPVSIRARLDGLADQEFAELIAAVDDHGGVLDSSTRKRLGHDFSADECRAFGVMLEEALLGSFEASQLANQGVQVGDGWLLLFREVADELLEELSVDEGLAEEGMRTGADGFADLRGIARSLEETPFKIKKNGDYYKNAVKRVAKEALSPAARPHGEEEDLLFYLNLMQRLEFVKVTPAAQLELTANWRSWQKQTAVERGEDLLSFCRRRGKEPISSLHISILRRNFFNYLKRSGFETWLPIERVTFIARNEYLRECVRPEHVLKYQDRHKRLPFPPLASPDDMRRAIEPWIVATPARLGIVELAYRDGEKRPFAVRLSRFGAKLLGLKVKDRPAGGAGLVLNSDYEIILFPENAGFEVIQEVGRFAERVKADYAIHFVLTRESVQAAAAAGFGEDEILKLLESHASHGVPKNVVYSIKEWCRKTVRLKTTRVYLLEAPDAATATRLAATPELKKLVSRRLGETVLELNEDPAASGLASVLRERGFYL
ncbi:MAG: helicase-associated domain-containing protein [Planctomycetota bacterium]